MACQNREIELFRDASEHGFGVIRVILNQSDFFLGVRGEMVDLQLDLIGVEGIAFDCREETESGPAAERSTLRVGVAITKIDSYLQINPPLACMTPRNYHGNQIRFKWPRERSPGSDSIAIFARGEGCLAFLKR